MSASERKERVPSIAEQLRAATAAAEKAGDHAAHSTLHQLEMQFADLRHRITELRRSASPGVARLVDATEAAIWG